MEERSSPKATDNIQPVRFLKTDDRLAQPIPGMALCLSGGGYRAMLFHLGSLWRLNQVGLLRGLVRISSVSGGSITAGVLGLHWKRLQFNETNVATNLEELVVKPIRQLADDTIDQGSIIKGILLPRRTIADEIASAYRKHLFGNATLQDLPSDSNGPRFVINATNVQDNVLWRFSKPFMGDYRVGLIRNPKLDLAVAVAASSAFPPFLSPVVLKLDPADFDLSTKGDLQIEPYTSEVVLTDGGVYDNLGLETAWKAYETILVSDGGGGSSDEPKPKREWLEHVYRVLNLLDTQVRSLRKRQVVGSYQLGLRKGTYWGIRTNIADYNLVTAMNCPFDKTLLLANTATRLKALDATLQEQIINWGYAVCDAAIRTHLNPALPQPTNFPYPDAGV
ncbi:MAG TPA: patatin-like phospholipase family protein [Pyrinomonadaceae bacterium]